MFSKVVVQGGGKLVIQSHGNSQLVLRGTEIEVESGGVIEADRVVFEVDNFIIHQAGTVHANFQVSFGTKMAKVKAISGSRILFFILLSNLAAFLFPSCCIFTAIPITENLSAHSP